MAIGILHPDSNDVGWIGKAAGYGDNSMLGDGRNLPLKSHSRNLRTLLEDQTRASVESEGQAIACR